MQAVDYPIEHDCCQLVQVFNATFIASEATCLRGGGTEPIYLPAGAEGGDPRLHCIVFTRDYFASALHEIAHWCVAGRARRQQVDYGYWYAPDGRSAAEQAEFERMEVRPQALEWLFSAACGFRFRVSADNLNQGLGASESFKQAIYQQVLNHCRTGVSPRVAALLQALMAHYRSAPSLEALLCPERFARESL